MTGRERILAMIEGRQADCLPLMPITMLFAARHIDKPYGEYVTNYRVLVEAQLRTAEAYGFYHVSAISDPARESADLGGAIEWFRDQPLALIEARSLLTDKRMLARLKPPDPLRGRMGDRVCGLRLLKERAGGDRMVEGWVEGPCALGADLRGINRLILDFFDDPVFVRDLFDFSVATEIEYARVQIDAGADLIGIGDAAASLVGPALYEEFVWPYEHKLVEGIRSYGGRIRLHICGRTRRLYAGMARLAPDIIDLDWPAPLAAARAEMGPHQVLAGNMDPVFGLVQWNPRARVGICDGLPPHGRAALHRSRRLRGSARHAAGESADALRVRTPSPAEQFI